MAGVSTWYVDADNGDSGNSGTSAGDAFALVSEAAAAAVSDASSSQIINLMAGGAHVIGSSISLTGLQSLTIRGYDSSGTDANDFEAFDFSERPVVQITAGITAFTNTTSSTTTYLRGLAFDGTDTAYDAFYSSSSTHALEVYDCHFSDFALRALRTRAGSIVERCIFRDMPDAIIQLTADLTINACAFIDINNHAVDRGTSKDLVVRNSLFYHCCEDNTSNDSPIERPDNVLTPENNLFVDNYSQHGLPGSTDGNNNCYTSDSGTYHTIDNFDGTTNANDYELDPLFSDEAGEDFRLDPSSPLLGAGIGPGVGYTLDRIAMGSPPAIGPYLFGLITDSSPIPVVRGTHQVRVWMGTGYLLTAAGRADTWTLTGGVRPPWVSTVTLGDAYDIGSTTTYQSATITTDRPMHEDTSYTLTTSVDVYDDKPFGAGVAFSGLRTSLRGGVEGTPAPILLDFHAPWVREDGLPGGFYDIGPDGDYRLTGGLDTVRKVLWAWLLTPRGSLAFAPNFGAPFELKSVRPADLELAAKQLSDGIRESLPWVDSSEIAMSFKDDHLRVRVSVEAFGDTITDTQEVPQ